MKFLLITIIISFFFTFSCGEKKEEVGDSSIPSQTTDNSTSDTTPPTVSSTLPSDSDTSVSISSSISVTFSETMNTTTVTTNTSDTTCSGTLQVSSDSFSTCVKMSSPPSVSNSYKTFSVSSSDNLSYSTTYKIRVTTGVKDSSGNSMSSQYETGSGFTSSSKIWSTIQFGTSSTDFGSSVVGDSSRNYYVSGVTSGGLDGNTNSGGRDIFLVKYDSTGVKKWTRQIGSSHSSTSVRDSNIDSSNNIYIIGSTSGNISGNTNKGEFDFFIIKYNSQGSQQWSKQIGTSGTEDSESIFIDSSDNIFICGYTNSNLDNQTNNGSVDIFLMKLNSNGEIQWTKLLGTSNDEHCRGVTGDSSGNLYITGNTSSSLNDDSIVGGRDIFLSKFNSIGTKVYVKQIGSTGDDWARKIDIDSSNNLILSDKQVAAIDIEDLIVIDTPDALMISKKGSSQKVKQVVAKLKEQDSDLTKIHTLAHRPWGTYEVLLSTQSYKIKRIVVKPGKRLSLQKHFHRNEHWIVVSGTATVTVGNEVKLIRPNESTYIKMGEVHRLENKGQIPVVLIEAQVGEYTGEDDIVRIEDDFQRD